MEFKQYIKQHEFVDFLLKSFDESQVTINEFNFNAKKPWSAKKKQILQMWKNLRPNVPINITPIDMDAPGGGSKSYGEDGIRITGTWNFIATVLGRIKDLMVFENPQTRLRLVFRGIDSDNANPDNPSYVFYINLESRSHGKRGRKKLG
jgi:hypothetical protein